MRPTKKTFLYI